MSNLADNNAAPSNVPRRESGVDTGGDSYGALITAARRLVGSMGYHHVTVDDVRKEAGVSRATFYFYFKNKRHLFIQMARSVMDDMYEVAGRHYPEREEYTRIILANAAYLEVWRRESKIMGEFFALSLVDEEIRNTYTKYRQRFEDRIAGRLARLLESGRIPPADPALLAATLSSMVEFFAFRFFATEEAISTEHYRFSDAVRVLSESWYRAVYGKMPPETHAFDAEAGTAAAEVSSRA
jgi:AcrR family transcriptional regulator